MGDFYETFEEDAIKAVDGYVRKLVAQGYKVAICEQLEDPKLAKGIVERGVTEVVTPGTALDEGFGYPALRSVGVGGSPCSSRYSRSALLTVAESLKTFATSGSSSTTLVPCLYRS